MLILEQIHEEPVTSLSWLSDGSGFISAGLDRKIIIWVCTRSVLHALLSYSYLNSNDRTLMESSEIRGLLSCG